MYLYLQEVEKCPGPWHKLARLITGPEYHLATNHCFVPIFASSWITQGPDHKPWSHIRVEYFKLQSPRKKTSLLFLHSANMDVTRVMGRHFLR